MKTVVAICAVVLGALLILDYAILVRPERAAADLPRPRTVHTDAALCIERCHRYGMIVREWDGAQSRYNGPWRGCVCGEVSR